MNAALTKGGAHHVRHALRPLLVKVSGRCDYLGCVTQEASCIAPAGGTSQRALL